MTFSMLKIETPAPDIRVVRLNRPEALNALSRPLMTELIAVSTSFHEQPDVRCVVFTGAGKHFSAGADLKEERIAPDATRLEARRSGRIGRDLVHAVRGIEAVTIAAIEGVALGGGACIATACDFRVAARDARCGYPEVNLGMNLQWQALPHCVRLIGPARAKRMIALGAHHGAEELERWGFVDELTEPGNALAAALELAREFAARPPIAVQMIKQSVNAVSDALDNAVMHMDQDQFTLTTTTDDFAEGIRSFRERRAPRFQGN